MKWFIQACDASLGNNPTLPTRNASSKYFFSFIVFQASIVLIEKSIVMPASNIILKYKYILNIKKMLMSTIGSSTIRIQL